MCAAPTATSQEDLDRDACASVLATAFAAAFVGGIILLIGLLFF